MTQAKWIVQQAFREGNLIPTGQQPTTAEQLEALYRLNTGTMSVLGFEVGENLEPWLFPAPQRTAPIAARYPQAPLAAFNPITGSLSSTMITPYPPTNRRIIFGSVTGTLWFPEQPRDGSRMALTQGSGKGDNGVPGQAIGALTQVEDPTATYEVVLGTTTYTWVSALTGSANQVLVGPTIAASLSNLVMAINGGRGQGVVYGIGTVANGLASATSDSATGTLTATALQSGEAGNSIASTTTDPNGAWAAATLLGGVVGALLTLDGNGRLIDLAPQQQYYTPVPVKHWFYNADMASWMSLGNMGLLDEMPFPMQFDDFWIAALAKRLAGRYNKIISNDTNQTYLDGMKRMKARYRQMELTTYGSENIPRTDQSYLGGQWWWGLLLGLFSSSVALHIFEGVRHATATLA